jgi:hypothetical protein
MPQIFKNADIINVGIRTLTSQIFEKRCAIKNRQNTEDLTNNLLKMAESIRSY